MKRIRIIPAVLALLPGLCLCGPGAAAADSNRAASLCAWLQQVPDAVPDDPQSLDMDGNGRLNAVDLTLYKRGLLQAGRLAGMSFEEAVAHGYIARAPYHRQITGALKDSIKAQLQRPVDYATDRFYPVLLAPGLPADRQFLYCPSTRDVYEITQETPVNCAVWFWRGSRAAEYHFDDDPVQQAALLDAMEFYHVTEIYYSIGANKLLTSKDTVAQFVQNAYARDMRVYLLTGENTWLSEDSYQTAIYRVFDNVQAYNDAVPPEAHLAGVSYDAEVWTNAAFDWKNDQTVRSQQLAFIQTAQQYANNAELGVSFCLPFWIVRYDCLDADGNVRNLYDAITETAQKTILMTYRDNVSTVEKWLTQPQTGASRSVLDYHRQNGCDLEIALQIDTNKEGDSLTFYDEEQLQPGCVRDAFDALRQDLSADLDHITFAIHQAVDMYIFHQSLQQS